MSENKLDGFNKSLEGEQKWPPMFVKVERFDIGTEESVEIINICEQHLSKNTVGQEKEK
jgi:hypothetical protein